MTTISFARRPLALFGIGLMLSACQSLAVYEGDRRPKSELAQIIGDTHLSGNLPVSILIRKVDGEELNVLYRGALVLPGEHDLLIDCTVTETQHITRHHLHVDVDAGVKYRLVADTGPGNRECKEVQLVTR